MEHKQILNADYSVRVVMETENMQWESSEADGVMRRRLERLEGDPEPVTTVVRYLPNSSFPAHRHINGEEIFVLEGTFSDNHGEYSAGTYLRNPPGSSHVPYCEQGCTIFVKLQQFQTGDVVHLSLQTKQQNWLPGLVPGLQVMPLHEFNNEHTALVKWEPNTQFQSHVHIGGEEIFCVGRYI